MSVPHQTTSYSTSPSKSSLRRPSIPQNTQIGPSRSLLPPPHLDSPIAQQDDYEDAIIGGASSTNPPVPNFQPFFALIEDTITHEHFHPTVHYLFADDDADIITDAACRSLEDDDGSRAVASGEGSRYAPHVKEHYLVLDVHADGATGFEVTHAQSFSPEWQVLRTQITNAPTIGDSPEDEGLMLRIEGRGNTPPGANAKEKEKESLEEMVERFQKRLDDVRQVMEAGKLKGEDDE